MIFNSPAEEVTTSERNTAKTICLGILYGMGLSQLAQRLGKMTEQKVNMSTAKALLEAWHSRFPRVRPYLQEVIRRAKEAGYVRTLR